MKIVKKFESFILEFKETEKNTPVLYKDNNLEVKVVKTFDACAEQGKDTKWCSNTKYGYYIHNKTANMYRFNFNDGYKLRLTWDYINSRKTHWGQGGIVNGETKPYIFILPKDDTEPFLFDYKRNDQQQELVDRIESIPQYVIDLVHDYQLNHSIEKSEGLNKMYNEISKIKVIDVNKIEGDKTIVVKIEYLDKKFKIETHYDDDRRDFYFFRLSNEFKKNFKNKMCIITDSDTLTDYLKDKTKEFIKKNNISL